ncbi:MAG: DUF2283 domain-containing protein [Gracilimonas sp.]|uniref:DUF2283 domain-containing protein n=1 Tax=Gracilimonas sp. TaxID=1974203 RepID=UPI003752B6F2|nr:DUF2283 domain-containing protein [Gracilimonas sp.]
MKIKYDKAADVLYLKLLEAQVAESDEDKPGIIIDYDEQGNMAGIELLEASRRAENPAYVIHEVA